MKKRILLLLFLFMSLTISADDGTAYTPPNPDMPLNCASPSTQIGDVTINELYNGGGGAGNLEFFEIYFNETTNINGWRLYANDKNTHRYTNLGIGLGDVTYPNGSTGVDNLTTYTYPKGTFIVYNIGNIDPTNGEVFIANTNANLTNNANAVVDYFKYYKTSEQTYYTVTNTACSTALTGADSNAKDISRLTDGSGDFYQYYPGTTTLVDYTTGSSNLENLPPNSTLKANVSIQADFNQTQAYSGDLITLTLKITNPSTNSITVTDVNVTNLIPAGLSYVSNNGGTLLDPVLPSNPYGTVTATAPTFKWRLINGTNLLSFPSNSIAEINITLLVTATGGTVITDTATLGTKQTNQGTISSSDTINILSPSAIADYRFDNCIWLATDTFPDATGNYNGTAEALTSADGKICKAGDFTANSATDVVRLPNTLLSGLTNFTYSVWIKASSTGAQQELLQGVRNSASINEVEFYLDSNDKVRVNIKNSGQDFGLTNNEITDNTWKHLVFTRNGGTMCLYINGALKQCQSGFSTGALSIDSNGLVIGQEQDSTGGSFSNSQDYQGLMDEVTVFNSALSAAEISILYSNQNNGKNYNGSNRTCSSCDAPALNNCGTENFSEYSTSVPLTANWNIITATNYTPNVQNGRLVLSNTTPAISTALTLRGSLPASNNYLEITFQSFAYGGNGADGMTVTLSDASVTPSAGAFGGSLGYAQKSNPGSDCTTVGGCPGFAGGWLGFGLDEYGNFSNPTEGRIGGPGAIVDSFSIRGTGSGLSGYNYIAGTATLTPGIDNTAGTPANPLPGHYYRLTIDTRNSSTLVKVERDTGSGYTSIIPWTNATQAAAAPANYLLSLTASTGASTNYHAADNLTLKALSCGSIQIIPPSIRGQFDAWDTFRSISDRNISTKIVAKAFDLNISSLNASRDALQDYNGTVCVRLTNSADQNITGWNKLLFSNVKNMPTTFTLNRAIGGSDSASVDIHWKNNTNTACPLALETDTAHSSDRFSVRPASFALSAPNAVAGSDFNITFTAPNFSTTASTEYNETVGNSFDVAYTEHNASCRLPTAQFTPDLSSGWSFINGTKAVTTRYNEVGVVDINISDTSKACNSRYAKIDCDDADVSGFYNTLTDLPIGTAQAQITVKPHHFDLNATLVNSGSGAFTYLSTDLNMSSKLDLNVTAKNEQNITTLNYDKGCYAKTTTLTLPHSTVPNPLSTILVHENLSNINTNISKSSPINLSFNKTIFTQGLAPLNLLINFDRSRSQPLNPFDFNLSSATLTDSDGTTGTTTPKGTANYVYGRARAYDIKTDQSPISNPIELEIYSSSTTGYVSSMPQNVLYWYRNLNHNTLSQGSILSGDDYSSTTQTGPSSTITINPLLISPLNGLHNVRITNPDAIAHAIVHLTIPSWLWYSTVNNYDISNGTTCMQHPCFDYQYFGTSSTNLTGVNSGTFQGSDFTLTPAKTIIKKGVKVFR